MGDRTTTMRAQAIEGFAAMLADLRESVGRPSFRVMAGRSKAISHTTLHEAVHGNRLPSWATTAEFVKACGADPRRYRDRWDEANRTVVSATRGVPRPVQGVADLAPPAAPRELGLAATHTTQDIHAHQPERATRVVRAEPAHALNRALLVPGALSSVLPARWHPERRTLLGVATLVVTVATGLGLVWSDRGEPGAPQAGASAPAAADCPVHQQDPPAAPAARKGDRATFVADVTLNDCSHVQAGQTLPKVWRLKNTGSVPWVGYTLHRIDLPQARGQCQTIPDVPVPDTAPGQVVDVRVDVSVPTTPTFCLVRFKMVDAGGEVAFPGSRPVNFQVIVDPSNSSSAQAQGPG